MNWFHRPPLHPAWLAAPVAVWLAASALGWI